MQDSRSPDPVLICPNCGDSVESLDEFTGWCSDCSPATQVTSNGNSIYLASNADRLEHHISQGRTLNQAIDELAKATNGYRPSCIVCGRIIAHAPKTSVICRKTPECRRVSRRYVYLYTDKGMTKAQAFATIMQELGTED